MVNHLGLKTFFQTKKDLSNKNSSVSDESSCTTPQIDQGPPPILLTGKMKKFLPGMKFSR